MVKNVEKDYQTELGIRTLDYGIPSDHISRFIVEFVEENFEKLNIKQEKKNKGRKSFPLVSMLKLLVYAKIDHNESSERIADNAKFHMIYKYVSDDIQPSVRSIQRYKSKFEPYYEELVQMTLKKASDEKFTQFNHVAIDGTIKKAYNSNNNVITKKETQILLDYFNGVPVPQEKLDKLHKPAEKILKYKKMDTEDKLELLYDINTQFTYTGQNKVPVNDIEARFMKNKKGNFMVAYNIQSAVDYDTKLICAINVVQNPTDHYQLPEIVDKAIINTQTKPKHISADTIYLNQISLAYLADNKINGLIPTRKQSKEKQGRLNKNPYHKDHFQYDSEKDAFLCPENQYMYFFRQYTNKNIDNENPKIVKRLYSNYNACKHCDKRDKCLSTSTTHKTITEYGSELKKAMMIKMEKPENQEEYSKRSCVEGPFGTLKEEYLIEKEKVVGMNRTEQKLYLDALAYNLKRLYNIKQGKQNKKQEFIDFCKRTSTMNQLKLDVTIF
jgi:hypothetical protein